MKTLTPRECDAVEEHKVSVTGLQRVGGKMVEDEAGEVAGTRLCRALYTMFRILIFISRPRGRHSRDLGREMSLTGFTF